MGKLLTTLVDTRSWPLVRVSAPPRLDLHATEAILGSLAPLLERDEQLCALIDLRATTSVGLAEVRRVAEFVSEHRDALLSRVRFAAFVSRAPEVRAALKILFQLQSPVYPYRLYIDLDPALDELAAHAVAMRGSHEASA